MDIMYLSNGNHQRRRTYFGIVELIQATARSTMLTERGKTFSSAVLLFALLFFVPTVALSASPPADPRPEGDSTASTGSENTELRKELEQLKQLVQQQQARITALEYQNLSATASPAAGAAMTDLSSPVLGDPVATPAALTSEHHCPIRLPKRRKMREAPTSASEISSGARKASVRFPSTATSVCAKNPSLEARPTARSIAIAAACAPASTSLPI